MRVLIAIAVAVVFLTVIVGCSGTGAGDLPVAAPEASEGPAATTAAAGSPAGAVEEDSQQPNEESQPGSAGAAATGNPTPIAHPESREPTETPASPTETPTPTPDVQTPPRSAPTSGTGTPPSNNSGPNSGPNSLRSGLDSLPPCDESNKFSAAPIDSDAYEFIIPLGLLTAPQHILPTPHIYYRLVSDDSGDRGQRRPKVADVRAPGDIRVLGLNVTESTGGPQGDYTDYDILFAPCQDRMFTLIHVSSLSPELERLQQTTTPDRCNEYGFGEGRTRFCEATVQLDVTAGSLLGTTGGKVSNALDLEAYDFSSPPLAYINPSRYFSPLDKHLYIACPFDWFTDELRTAQLARVGGSEGQQRTIEPVCGEVMQDLPGTAQGNWFFGESTRGTESQKQLALVHDHVDPSLAAISVGGTVAENGVWVFTPEETGLINREFSQVGPDGATYCYHGAVSTDGGRGNTPFPGRLLLSMPEEGRLLLERQDGDCGGQWELINPVEYLR